VLKRGAEAYRYNSSLAAQLARQYAMDGQVSRARKLVEEYRRVFPKTRCSVLCKLAWRRRVAGPAACDGEVARQGAGAVLNFLVSAPVTSRNPILLCWP